jgi:hypothetical protein
MEQKVFGKLSVAISCGISPIWKGLMVMGAKQLVSAMEKMKNV